MNSRTAVDKRRANGSAVCSKFSKFLCSKLQRFRVLNLLCVTQSSHTQLIYGGPNPVEASRRLVNTHARCGDMTTNFKELQQNARDQHLVIKCAMNDVRLRHMRHKGLNSLLRKPGSFHRPTLHKNTTKQKCYKFRYVL